LGGIICAFLNSIATVLRATGSHAFTLCFYSALRMNKLSFWHKLAFIANTCWLLTWALKYYEIIPKGDLQSTVIITGLITANIVNGLVNLYTGFLFSQSKLPDSTPRWLMIANFLFLIPQLYPFFK
jgi:hypothetical protein